MSTKPLVVRIKYDLVLSRLFNSDSIVSVGIGPVEIEDEEQTTPFKDDNLVLFVLERDVSLRCTEPLVRRLGVVHSRIEAVEVFVPQQFVIDQVELATSILERTAVALP